jgi:hypothetical protein
MKEVTFTPQATSDLRFQEVEAYNRIPVISGTKPQAEEPEFSAGEKFLAGQFKYNPIVSGSHKAFNWLRSEENDVPGYSPYDDLKEVAGYPMELFIHSDSPHETTRIKMEYDRDNYFSRVHESSPIESVASSIAAGAMNPLYIFPYLRVGQQFKYTKSALNAGMGEAATELTYHGLDLDHTRTSAESIFNIAAGSIVGGILGGALSKNMLTPDELKLINDNLKKELAGPSPHRPVDTSNKITDLDDIEVERINKKWRWAAKLTPIDILASQSSKARALGSLLGEQTVVGTQRAAVETAIKSYDSHLGLGLSRMIDNFRIYRKRTGDRMPYEKFKVEVSRALRNGDEHTIQEIADTARIIRRETLDKVRNKARDVGIYPSDENIARFAKSYFPRMYNFEHITAKLDEFKTDISTWLRASFGDEAHEGVIKQATDEIAAKIRHDYYGQNSLTSIDAFKVSALKNREISIPDNSLEKWLINDPEYVLRAWTHNMATQTEMTRMFGDSDLKGLIKEVEIEWDDIIANASKTNAAKALKLEKRKHRDLQLIHALRDRLLNRYALPDNPTSTWVRAGRMARNLNVLRSLGGMTLSALPDIARPLYHRGFGTYAKALHKLSSSADFRKMARADASRMGIALEMVLNQRLTAISELDYLPALGKGGIMNNIEYGLEKMVIGRGGAGLDFGRLSLMTPWNSSMKMLTFTMAQDGLLRHLDENIKHAKKLRVHGINDEMAKRIKAQWKEHGTEDGGLRLGNSDKWSDHAAADAFEQALIKEVDATIVTPGIMDKPLWTSSEIGKVIGQFKSFAFAATNKQFLSGVHNFDAMVVQGSLSVITLGAMLWMLKAHMRDPQFDSSSVSPEELLIKGIEYSGVIGFGSELVSFGTGMANAAGIYKGDGNFRWARQGLMGSIAGPSAGLASDIFRGARVFTRDEPNAGDVEALRRVLPYNNLFYIRKIFDAAEEAGKERLGITD